MIRWPTSKSHHRCRHPQSCRWPRSRWTPRPNPRGTSKVPRAGAAVGEGRPVVIYYGTIFGGNQLIVRQKFVKVERYSDALPCCFIKLDLSAQFFLGRLKEIKSTICCVKSPWSKVRYFPPKNVRICIILIPDSWRPYAPLRAAAGGGPTPVGTASAPPPSRVAFLPHLLI